MQKQPLFRFLPKDKTPRNVHLTYRPDIDGLRALAILSVVIFHAFPSKLRGGFVGVDIFFVISGFLISSIIFRSLERADFNFIEFYAHRIKRIFPALIVVMIASFVFSWFALLPDELKQLGKHMAAGAGFTQNFILWKEAGYFDTASELKPLMHLWSLAIEEQFYLIYPVLIWGAWRLGFNVLIVVLLLGLMSFGLNLSEIEKDPVGTFFLPQTRFWELLVGSLLAYLQLRKRTQVADWLTYWVFHPLLIHQLSDKRKQLLNNLISVLGMLLIVSAVFGIQKDHEFPGWRALTPVSGAFLLIFAGSETWINQKILANRLMVFVGLISYPLYLWHWPIISFARIIEADTSSNAIRIAAVVLSILLAWLTFQLVEKPIRLGRATWIKTAIPIVILAFVGYIGYSTFERNGFESRMERLTAQNSMFDWGSVLKSGQTYQDLCKVVFPLHYGNCELAKNIAPTIILLGDSHARTLAYGLRPLLNESLESLININGGGCIPFWNVSAAEKRADANTQVACLNAMNYGLSLAESNDSIRTVILASRGPLHFTGKGFFYGEFPDEQGQEWVMKLVSNPNLNNYSQIWESAMRSTLTRLQARGKRVIFVLDNPELGFDPKSCVDSRPVRLTNRVRRPCAVPRKDFDERNREYRDVVEMVLKDFPEVRLFDASKPLCGAEWCWAMKNGKVLYRDDDHLSVEGARYVAEGLLPLLMNHEYEPQNREDNLF